MTGWRMVRAKRPWVPEWLWRCVGNFALYTPWKQILTVKVDE